mmetsp:Transcript_30221/g.78094  ORF Transcript_30221/g.78094 Transcript_30221/m.78094 type:complete len:474 (-) Transcript_30221:3089-4510(-)
MLDPRAYLESLSTSSLDLLFSDEFVAIAVFRSLSPLSQQVVLRVLSLKEPFPTNALRTWVRHGQEQLVEDALSELVALRVMNETEVDTPAGTQKRVQLNLKLRKSLHAHIEGKKAHSKVKVVKNEPLLNAITKEARRKWRSIMCSLVASADSAAPDNIQPVQDEVFEVMEEAKLITAGRGGGDEVTGASVTPSGFRFLLKDTWEQVWTMLVTLFDLLEQQKSGPTRNDAVMLALRLGVQASTVDVKSSQISELPPGMQELLPLFEMFGLVRLDGAMYAPSPLSSFLTLEKRGKRRFSLEEEEKASAPGKYSEGRGIIVETNYSVHALNADYVQVQLLNLFLAPKVRFPNLFVGLLTRESVRKALDMGITADDIIAFLEAHSHPFQAKQVPVVPETVQDQIRFWQEETEKVTFEKVTLFSEFETVELLRQSTKYAKEMQVHMWSSEERNMLVTKDEGRGSMVSFIKAKKAEMGL